MSSPNEPFLDAGANPVYVRHRPRMVRESVYQDLRDTLILNQWMVGTTSDGAHTTSTTLALLENAPLNLIDYFPETKELGPTETPMNTFAMDIGEHGELTEGELGGFFEQPYSFNMAFYAKTDAVAIALMSDLYDRYLGLTDSPFITLYNYLPDPPTQVVRMEVENFRYARDSGTVSAHEVHLYFAALEITDYVDQARRTIV